MLGLKDFFVENWFYVQTLVLLDINRVCEKVFITNYYILLRFTTFYYKNTFQLSIGVSWS